MTYRELKQGLEMLTDEQLDMDITVSEGCDDNGNAEFFKGDAVCIVGDGAVDSAADGVLENGQVVILFDGGN